MEDFVTFEIAKKLKEKGFREECLCHYIGEDLVYNIESPIANNQLWFSHNKFDNIWHRDNHDAPTISQVLKWMREEKHIHITANMYQDESEDADGRIVDKWCFWNWDIQSCISGNILQDGDDTQYESYEEASLAGIEYVIDNLI